MKRVAVLMAKGYEEGETLTIVDLLRRANIECHTFYFDNEFVEGMHHMMIKADQKFSDEIKDLIMKGASSIEIRKEALKGTYRPLVIDGLNKILTGYTTLDELNKKLRIF